MPEGTLEIRRDRQRMEIVNIGIIASVDSGKTTLTEKILEKTVEGYSAGRIESGDTTTDFHSFERRRGITVFSEGADFEYQGVRFNLIDTPGHVDFFEETRKTMMAVDILIFLISAVDGVTERVKRIWEAAAGENIPKIVFINKCDIPHSRPEEVYREVRELSAAIRDADMDGEVVEGLCDADEEILRRYMEGSLEADYIRESIVKQIVYGKLALCVRGSAVTGEGIERLLQCIAEYYPKYPRDDEGIQWGLVYKVRWDETLGMLSYLKVLSGRVSLRDEVETQGGRRKISEIRRYRGAEFENLEEVTSGDLAVVRGLDEVEVGEYIGVAAPRAYQPQEASLVTAFRSTDYEGLRRSMDILNREQIFLNPRGSREQSQVEVSTYGEVHLEVLKEILQERFSIEADYLPPLPMYREGILECSRGFCHYEPKKHYARVEVEISPSLENTFISDVSIDVLPHRYQGIIEKTIPEALSSGVLLGRPLTGVMVRLIDGRAHEEHTHGGDFRIATIRAVTQALERNRSILLEPAAEFSFTDTLDGSGEDALRRRGIACEHVFSREGVRVEGRIALSQKNIVEAALRAVPGQVKYREAGLVRCRDSGEITERYRGRFVRDERLFNSVSLFREKKKMKKVR